MVYRSNSETIQQRLAELGRIIYAVLVRVKAKDGLLKRVFEEQYFVEHGQVTPRDRKAISADSVQNPNDPDAEYRQKGDQKVKGYSVNVTETTDQADAPSLITGVQVEGATAADNRALAVNGVFTGIQGRQSAYLLDESDGGGTARITDTRTGALRIPYPGDRTKYKWRYFLPKQLESMRSRKRMRKHELWALARCAWINLRRLVIFEAGTTPKGTPSGQNGFHFAISAIKKTLSQTFGHLIFCFYSPAATRKWAWAN